VSDIGPKTLLQQFQIPKFTLPYNNHLPSQIRHRLLIPFVSLDVLFELLGPETDP